MGRAERSPLRERIAAMFVQQSAEVSEDLPHFGRAETPRPLRRRNSSKIFPTLLRSETLKGQEPCSPPCASDCSTSASSFESSPQASRAEDIPRRVSEPASPRPVNEVARFGAGREHWLEALRARPLRSGRSSSRTRLQRSSEPATQALAQFGPAVLGSQLGAPAASPAPHFGRSPRARSSTPPRARSTATLRGEGGALPSPRVGLTSTSLAPPTPRATSLSGRACRRCRGRGSRRAACPDCNGTGGRARCCGGCQGGGVVYQPCGWCIVR